MADRSEYNREWRKANPDKVEAAEQRRQKKGRPKHKVYLKKWAEENRDRIDRYSRKLEAAAAYLRRWL